MNASPSHHRHLISLSMWRAAQTVLSPWSSGEGVATDWTKPFPAFNSPRGFPGCPPRTRSTIGVFHSPGVPPSSLSYPPRVIHSPGDPPKWIWVATTTKFVSTSSKTVKLDDESSFPVKLDETKPCRIQSGRSGIDSGSNTTPDRRFWIQIDANLDDDQT